MQTSQEAAELLVCLLAFCWSMETHGDSSFVCPTSAAFLQGQVLDILASYHTAVINSFIPDTSSSPSESSTLKKDGSK